MFLGVAQALVDLLVLLTVYPLALWAGVRICGAAGLSAHLPGPWPVFVSGLLVAAVAGTVGTFFALFRRRTRHAAARSLAAVLLNAAGLALATLVLNGVRLDPAPGWRQALALGAVASLFMLPRITLSLPVPGIASIVLVAYHCLVLWLICAAFACVDPRLHAEGFWQLAGAAAIMWAVEWPARLAVRRAQEPPLSRPGPARSVPAGSRVSLRPAVLRNTRPADRSPCRSRTAGLRQMHRRRSPRHRRDRDHDARARLGHVHRHS